MTIKNYSKQCLMISAGIMVLALLLSLFGMGINVGIDFSGGMSMQYTMGEAVAVRHRGCAQRHRSEGLRRVRAGQQPRFHQHPHQGN